MAVDPLKQAAARHLNLDTILLLGDVYSKLGDYQAAGEQYRLAEGGEATLGAAHDPHRVALFWGNRNENIAEAVEIAKADYAKQKDIYASDTLAWCLYRAGQPEAARRFVAEAMRLGTADAKIYYHAGMIELSLGSRLHAKRLLER